MVELFVQTFEYAIQALEVQRLNFFALGHSDTIYCDEELKFVRNISNKAYIF